MIKTVVYEGNQALTDKQILEIEEAKNTPISYDKDCPKLSPDMMKAFRSAVAHRNRRKV